MNRSRRVAVIGAGPSGLVTTKELRDQGHQVDCFEAAEVEGGLFRSDAGAFNPDFRLTVSQYYMAFSSLPPPLAQERDFWSRAAYLEYLHRFAETFRLFESIRFGARVTDVQPAGSGFAVRWEGAGARDDEVYDAVAVCRGAFRAQSPRIPRIDGLDSFPGEVIHSADCVGLAAFEGKRVICVGLGETSADVTAAIATVAARCWLSVRRRGWLIARHPMGRPYTNDAYSSRLRHWNPGRELGPAGDRLRKKWQSIRNSELFDRMDEHHRFIVEWNSESTTVGHGSAQKNCAFIDGVLKKQIEVVPHGIERIEGSDIHFADGTCVAADALVFCTGYEEGSHPAPAGWFGVEPIEDVRGLFKHAFHPELRERVAFIGWARPEVGGAPACSEMIARYFSLLCSGDRVLPPPGRLEASIDQERKREDEDFWAQPYMRTLVQYTEFMDGVAELVGCEPHSEDSLDDPELLYKLICGSNIALSYRLRGPGAMPELARKVMLRLPVAFPALIVRKSLSELLPRKFEPDLAARISALCEPYIERDERIDARRSTRS